MPRAVIVGAGAAGDAAAFSLREHGWEGEVVLVGRERHRPYERPYLSKQYLRGELPESRVYLRSAEEYERQGIELLLGRTATGGDRGALVLDDGRRLAYDALVLATGGRPRRLEGAPEASNVLTLRSLDDSRALRQLLAESERIVLLGAGFIGAEVAASARSMGKEVLLIEAAPVPLGRALGGEMGQIYARIHRSRGVDLRTNTTVNRWLTSGDRVQAVELSDGKEEEADVVLLGLGIEPEVTLARELGLELEQGGVMVDETLRAAPDIYCAGDIAAHLHPVFGRRLRVEHWQVAQRQGYACGAAIAGSPAPYAEIPWFWSDQYDLNLQYLGNAYAFDQTVWRGDPDGESFSVFYLKEGIVEAVLSVNDARTGRRSRELIRRRVEVDAEALSDGSVDVRELVPA